MIGLSKLILRHGRATTSTSTTRATGTTTTYCRYHRYLTSLRENLLAAKPPKGFGKFYPKNGKPSGQKPKAQKPENAGEKGTTRKKSWDLGWLQVKTTIRTDGGGGGGRKPGDDGIFSQIMNIAKKYPFRSAVFVALVVHFLSNNIISTSPRVPSKEVNFQMFRSFYLEPGEVSHIVCEDRATARVYLKDDPSVSRVHFYIGDVETFEASMLQVVKKLIGQKSLVFCSSHHFFLRLFSFPGFLDKK